MMINIGETSSSEQRKLRMLMAKTILKLIEKNQKDAIV
jgi:hypothetical protein